jgi:phage terminase large subunit-like protein
MKSDLLATLQDPVIVKAIAEAPPNHGIAHATRIKWLTEAHDHQVLPHGDWWSIWLLLGWPGSR